MVNGTVESSSPPTLVNHSVAPRSHDLPVLLHTPYVYVIVAKWQPPRMQELEEVEEHHQAACSCLGCLPLLGQTNPHSSHLRGWQSIIFCCIVFVSRLNALLAVPHCTTPPTHVSSSVCGHARSSTGISQQKPVRTIAPCDVDNSSAIRRPASRRSRSQVVGAM